MKKSKQTLKKTFMFLYITEKQLQLITMKMLALLINLLIKEREVLKIMNILMI